VSKDSRSMSRRRLLVYLALFVTGLFALFGLAIFAIGILTEFSNVRSEQQLQGGISPAIQIALAGFCFAGLMAVVFFGLVALLIARQTRLLGSGYGDAYRLIEEFKFHEAIPLLERSLREGKETPDVLMLLTSAYAYAGQLAKAQATADRSVQLFPDNPGSYVTLANGYRLQAAYDESAAVLRTALEHAPDQSNLLAELGFTLYFAGNHSEAIKVFQQAASHAMPALYGVRVYYHLARYYQQTGDTEQAVKATAKMMSARDGLDVWVNGLKALNGTAYGSALRYEVAAIEQAITDADEGNLG
jgi:tetratricopeptide (TPR) repeat protein